MGIKIPLVLTDGQQEQLQCSDEIEVPSLQDQINRLKMLFAKLVANQVSIGIPVADPELIELLNNI